METLCSVMVILSCWFGLTGRVSNQELIGDLLNLTNIEADAPCNLVINEINSDDPQYFGKSDFLEFISYCDREQKSTSLQGFKVIGISTGTANSNKMTVELVINLWNNRTNENGFLTVAGPNVPNADSYVPNPSVHFHNQYQRNQKTMDRFLKTGNKDLQAIAVLYNKRSSLPEFTISKSQVFIQLNEELKNIIKDNLVDLVVYGRRAPYDSCELFLDLYPGYANRKYVLREFDLAKKQRDITLNRCTLETNGFLPEKYKLGDSTPGRENDCTGTHFLLEEHLTSITPGLQDKTYNLEDTEMNEASLFNEDTAQCTSSQITSQYLSSTISAIENVIEERIDADRANVCTLMDLDSDAVSTTSELNLENRRKRKISDSYDYSEEFEWETTKYFRDDWIGLIDANQRNLIPSFTVSKNKNWFEYLFNSENPVTSRYRCRLCHKYFDAFNLDKRHKSTLASDEGHLNPKLEKNRDIISGHAGSKTHLSIVEILKKGNQKRLRTDFEVIRRENESNDNNRLKVTSRMLRTVYVSNRLTMPFSSHSGLVTLQELNDIDMGRHHYERTSCTRITEFISRKMHETLITSLLEKNVPISIIIDGSSDTSRIHYLIMYFQTIEKDYPVIYFYRLLEVNDETSLGLFNLIKNAWESESGNFLNYMKRNLVGFASDGASVNVGRSGGLVQHMKNFATNPIASVHCMAHRLELAIQHSFEINDETMTNIGLKLDNLINSIYSFYNDRTHKRKTHLKNTADRIYKNRAKKFYELVYIFQVRWISTNYRAMSNIHNMLDALAIDLNEISTDTSFSQSTRNKAFELKTALLGKNSLLLFHFFFDISYELSFWSLTLQKRSGILIDFKDFKNKMTATFHLMKNLDPKYLLQFLGGTKCTKNDNIETNCKSLGEYEASSKVTFNGLQLLDDGGNMPKLSSVREKYLDSLIGELESYFPDGNLEDFDVLSPAKMPKMNDESAARLYGIQKIGNLAKFFNIDEKKGVEEWQVLLMSIVKSNNYCTIKRDEAEAVDFWSNLLSWNEIAWGDNIRKLVETVLVIPISSAEAERGFSVMNHVRNDRRKRLSGEHLEDIMRIKLNGPDDISRFGAAKYADWWVRAGKMKTDDPLGRGNEWKSQKVEVNEESKKYSLLRSAIF